MLRKKRLLLFAALVLSAYVVYPYVTLARLGAALSHGDAKTLENLIAWGPVREGIKEDISDDVPDDPAVPAGGLRPFGFSFAHTVASNLVDAHVSPNGILAATRHFDQASLSMNTLNGVKWAFFETPTQFVAELQPPGMSADQPPVRVQMELQGLSWKVTRVWLPHVLLAAANGPN